MTRINGREVFPEMDAVGEGLPYARNGEGDFETSMKAHCNAFLAKRGLPLNPGDFRVLAHAECQAIRLRRTERKRR